MTTRSACLALCWLTLMFARPGHSNEPIQDTEDAVPPVQATLALTSNYINQGVSLTNNKPAVQAGITYTIPDVDVYANVWASNTQFSDSFYHASHLEVDVSVGATNTVGNWTYDVFIARYNYPHTDFVSYNEAVANVQFHAITTLFAYSNSVFSLGLPAWRYSLGLNYDIPPQWVFHIKDVNLTGFAEYNKFATAVGVPNYRDYQVQLTKTIDNYQLSLTWTTTSGIPMSYANLAGNKLALAFQLNLA